jgi:hypothetical protein
MCYEIKIKQIYICVWFARATYKYKDERKNRLLNYYRGKQLSHTQNILTETLYY